MREKPAVTNERIKDKAPIDYLVDAKVSPTGPDESLLCPHFIDWQVKTIIEATHEEMSTRKR